MFILRLNFCCIWLALLGFSAQGGNLEGQPFEFYGQEQPLTQVLTAIATHSRLGVDVNENINADFSGHLKQRNSLEALNYLAASFDLVWYCDGATIFVDPINAMKSQMFQLDKVVARQVKETMKDLSIWDERFEWRSLNNQAILMVSGPPRYLELVEETIDLLNEQYKEASSDGLGIKVFKLINASAADRKVTIRDEEIILPGVASLLQGLLRGGARSQLAAQENDNKRTVNIGEEDKQDADDRQSLADTKPTTREINTFKGGPHPQAAIYADPSTNSVIVQDYVSRLLSYADLVRQLDEPRQQLEISLLIIDLTTNSLLDMGVNWNIATQGKGKGLLELILPGASTAGADTLSQTNADFLATVTALESQGKAKVTSRPAVVTENGLEASLDNNETFFVRVQGERVASLEQITFGTLLQVVPRIINEDESDPHPFISLDVKIEDANRLVDGGVDALPSIRNTQITTRSSVPNGGSLLIGGYYRESTSTSDDGIPILGRLPVVGNLFRRSGDSSSQLVRLFMLSARILKKSVFDPEPDLAERKLSDAQQIRQVSDLSNYNPRIKKIPYNQTCESALSARLKRNNYREAQVPTRMVPCYREGFSSSYRVLTQ